MFFLISRGKLYIRTLKHKILRQKRESTDCKVKVAVVVVPWAAGPAAISIPFFYK